MTVKFLHTSDWQLGVTRQFFASGPQDRWATARNDAITALCTLAIEEKCEFIVVAGDVFETNFVSGGTVLSAIEALKDCLLPIYLLPGNHDCLEPSNVYESTVWRTHKPPNVHVIRQSGHSIVVRPGVEVVGAPWMSKRPTSDGVAEAARALLPLPTGFRVMVGHGTVDTLSPDPDNPAIINTNRALEALADHRYHYLALGDRHSTTNVTGQPGGRIWYSGTPEAYDFVEVDNGNVLLVEAEGSLVRVTPRTIGKWHFVVHEEPINTQQDLDALSAAIADIPNKTRTVLKLGLTGTLTMTQKIALDQSVAQWGDLFAAVVMSSSRTNLTVVAHDQDFAGLKLSGYGSKALEKLRGQLTRTSPGDTTAADALALLVRLQGAPG
jgi:DNA repair exonuclease SbcCD nuclease subunit